MVFFITKEGTLAPLGTHYRQPEDGVSLFIFLFTIADVAEAVLKEAVPDRELKMAVSI